MDTRLAALMQNHEETRKKKFHEAHEVFVLALQDHPIRTIGLPRMLSMNEAFIKTVQKIKNAWHKDIWRADYFKEPLPPQFSQGIFPSVIGNYFWYLILSLRENSAVDRERLIIHVQTELQELCTRVNLAGELLTRKDHPEQVDFHFSAQQMHSQLSEKSPSRKPSPPKHESTSKAKKEDGFKFPQDKMTIQEFCDTHRDNATFLANDVLEFVKFLRHEDRGHKYTREEDLPLLAFIRHSRIEPEAELALGRESSRIDFQIFRTDGNILQIEVTQALPKNGHQYRHALVAHLTKLPLHERTLHQAGKDRFPDLIVEAITNKHKIKYPGSPILLVSVLGEYTDEDDYVIAQWIDWIKERSELRSFAQILLVELARKKVFTIL